MTRSLLTKIGVALLMSASLVALVGTRVDAAAPPLPRLTSADIKELDQMQEEVARFEEATKDYKGTVKHIVQQQYTAKRKALMSKYQTSLDYTEKEEKARRASAIELFEKFLQNYKHDERWTPDVMFRLAELYFEKFNDEYNTKAAAGDNSPPDYTKTIDLYKQLITDFPNYRLIDGAYYLMGYCLNEMNKEGEALQSMRALVCANKFKALDPPPPPSPSKGRNTGGKVEDIYAGCEPVKKDSRFLPEAWTRVGEYHFDNSELEPALSAYQQVLKFPNSLYFDKALYKLAWTYYRADDYPEAVKRFDELVVYSDKKKAETGGEGSDLRAEAVQYLGISFAEKDWNGDGVDDPETGLARAKTFYKGREAEPHVHEIFAKLGDIYFDSTDYPRAIEVYKYVLQQWPFDAGNPKLQDRVITCYERLRDFPSALTAREELARNYLKGTEWYKKNRDNQEAINSASELAELALITAAVNHHKAAQDLSRMIKAAIAAHQQPDPKMVENVQKEYATAATAYAKYLEQYPNSKNTYEYSYSYADTLYYSGRFLDAATQYEKVRDSTLDNKYAEDAAFSTIKSYEKYLDEETKAKRYEQPPLPEDGKTPVPVQPMAIPEPVLKMQKAYDVYIERVPASGRIPLMSYKAAEIDFRYLHWDTARPRLENVLNKYCKSEIGGNAGNALLTSYTVEKNLDKIEEWANKLRTAACGTPDVAAKNEASLATLALGVKFKKADILFADGKFEEAAKMYIQIVDADPKAEDADKALNNAAVAYEKVSRFAAATKLYERIVTDYPASKFVDDALFRTAVTYQKSFDFDRAVSSYLRLAEDKRFADSQHRTDAIYNSGVILDNDQDYAKAAGLFQRYAADPKVKKEEASEAYFRSALSYEKLKDHDRAIKTFNEYIRTYGSDPKNSEKVIEAEFRIGQNYDAKKDHKDALIYYGKVVAGSGNIKPAVDAAEYPAHAAFILAEDKLPIVEKAVIKGTGKTLEAAFKKLRESVAQVRDEYSKVLKYSRVTWQLAAFFRTGYIYEIFSKNMLASPCPPEAKKLGQEACDMYRQAIEQQVTSVDEEAVKRYTVTLQKAGELGVSNEWTRLARNRANAYRPDLFPMVKDERVEMDQP